MNEYQILREADDLLGEVKRPQKQQKPSNIGLYFVLVFMNLVGVVLDVISAVTVHKITGGMWLYSVLTFFAGILPFLMWELAFTRPFASHNQRVISIIGVLMAIVSILTIGVVSAWANVIGEIDAVRAEMFVIISLVILAVAHGLLAGIYYYTDEGIRAAQTEAQNMAYYKRQDANYARAEKLLEQAARIRQKRMQLNERYKSPKALEYLLTVLNDDDGDGILNFADPDYRLPAVQRANGSQPNPTSKPERTN